jgi:SRSO17 transposase
LWDADLITMLTLQLLEDDPLTASVADGVLVSDGACDRKDGCATDHVTRQHFSSVGKVDNGIMAATTLWAN